MRQADAVRPRQWPLPVIERFWAQATMEGECLVWGARRFDKGYGSFAYGDYNWRAHRVAYELTNAGSLGSLHSLHHCDNPPCIRPGHLFAGTNADNKADYARKGLGKGRENPSGDQHWKRLRPELIRYGARHPGRPACVHGHALTPENRVSRGNLQPGCRQCDNQRSREYRQRQREKNA